VKEKIVKNRRKIKRTVCNLETAFSFDQKTFKGRIENMSNYGAIVSADEPIHLSEGKSIRLTIVCDGREDILDAEVVWSDADAFGAKFIRDQVTSDDMKYFTANTVREGR
jgi:hypothetical protein